MELHDYQNAVLISLENLDYDWRTIEGISRELNLSEDLVEKILKSKALENQVIRSSIINDDGQILYTTREHYEKTQPLINKILSALSGEIK